MFATALQQRVNTATGRPPTIRRTLAILVAVCQMDEVTQQNAALVEEAAAAAGSLQDQAGHLTRVVGVFTIGTATVPAPKHVHIARPPVRPSQPPKQLGKAAPSANEWEHF